MISTLLWILVGLVVVITITQLLVLVKQQHLRDKQLQLNTQIDTFNQQLNVILPQLDGHLRQQTESLTQAQQSLKEQLTKQIHSGQMDGLKQVQTSLQQGLLSLQQQISNTLKMNADTHAREIHKLTQSTESQLKSISGQVEKRLSDGFEKTNATFANIMQRLVLIDVAQKKITELSHNVVSLQNILSDKQSRGLFGEVQLSGLIRNVMPESSFALQHSLSNGKRADCILFLPPPTGNVVIDAKFPLENYQRLMQADADKSTRTRAQQQFRQDVKKHIQDIANKYIIETETAGGAIMFIPAEAIFAEIHAHYPELVQFAQQQNVWLASPTTIMAILTTSRAVLKDAATRSQIHIIQEHLTYLAKDFSRFQTRMDDLTRHIRQAHEDVSKVNTSAKKISKRFEQIEQVELEGESATSHTAELEEL